MEFELFTPSELRKHAATNPIGYLVEGILKEGTFNICSGEAKSGKSTLIRHLAASVANGTPFLGKKTKQGDVLYICPDEPDTSELAESFRLLGAGENVMIGPNPVDRSRLCSMLAAKLDKFPSVNLVVLDTLAKTIEYEDLNSYDKVVRDIGPIQDLAREHGVVILAMHHTNKGSGNSIAASLMGSGGIASIATTVLEVSSLNNRRYLRSLQRYGREIERTELCFDHETGIISLGRSASDRNEAVVAMRSSVLDSQIVKCVRDAGTVTRRDIRDRVKAHVQAINRATDKLTEQGIFTRMGSGKSSDPYLYKLAEMPAEAVPAAA